MDTLETGRQAERVGIVPTLAVVVAEKGIALPEAVNQCPCNIGEEYAKDNGNAFFYFFLYHFINHPTFRPLDWCRLYTHNKDKNQIQSIRRERFERGKSDQETESGDALYALRE
jgi:hypothetical protein